MRCACEFFTKAFGGDFSPEAMISLPKLYEHAEKYGLAALDACLLPIDAGLGALKELVISDLMAWHLGRGKVCQLGPGKHAGCVRLKNPAGRFVGIGEILADGTLLSHRLLAASEQGTMV